MPPNLRTLNVAIPSCPPFFQLIENGNESYVEGTQSFILEFIQKMMKFRAVLIPGGGCSFGELIGPDNWTGVTGLFQRKEADIMMDSLEPSVEIEEYVGFGNPVDTSICSVLSGPPSNIRQKSENFLAVFNMQIWSTIIVCWIAYSTVSVLMFQAESRVLKSHSKEYSMVLLEYFGIIWKKGSTMTPVTSGHQLLLMSWLIPCFVLTTLFEGTFFAKLAVVPVPERIEGVHDLPKYPDKLWTVVKGLLADKYLETAEDPTLVKVWNRVVRMDTNLEIGEFYSDKMMDAVYRGETVIISEVQYILSDIVGFYCKKELRPYYVGKDTFSSMPFVSYYRKSWDPALKEQYVLVMTWYVEAGFYTKWKKDLKRSSDPCFIEGLSFTRTQTEALGLRSLRSVFELLLQGLAASLFVFFAEICSRPCLKVYARQRLADRYKTKEVVVMVKKGQRL